MHQPLLQHQRPGSQLQPSRQPVVIPVIIVGPVIHMGVSNPKNRRKTPQIMNFNRVFHEINHPFFGVKHPYYEKKHESMMNIHMM